MGKTLLHGRTNPDVIGFLLDQGLDVNATTYAGQTPLHMISMNFELDAARMLLNAGGNVDVVDQSNSTPLDSACRVGNRGLVELLLDNTKPPTLTRDQERRSAFYNHQQNRLPAEHWRLTLHVLYHEEDNHELYRIDDEQYSRWEYAKCQVCFIVNEHLRDHDISDCTRCDAQAAKELLQKLEKVDLPQLRRSRLRCNICGARNDTHHGIGLVDTCYWMPTVRRIFAALFTTKEGYFRKILLQYAQQTSNIDVSREETMMKWLAQEVPAVDEEIPAASGGIPVFIGLMPRLTRATYLLVEAYGWRKHHEHMVPVYGSDG